MPNIAVYNMSGKKVGDIELSDAVFGIAPNMDAVHAVVKNHLANRRQGTQSTLTRAEVSGGGIKPWRQKGTGRARQGSTRAPHWKHGGIAFGPKPRSYRYTVNKKLRRLAIKSALSDKVLSGNVVIIDDLKMDEIKTKTFLTFMKAVDVSGKALVITPEVRENVYKSARNIEGVKTTIASILNVYDIVGSGKLILDRAAAERIQEVYA